MSFVCVYRGAGGECWECGGFLGKGSIDGRFCTDDCAFSYAANQADMEARAQARRDADDAYGAEVARLREQGWDDDEIDDILADMA